VTWEQAAFNPAQQHVLDVLGAAGADRPEFDAGLRAELRVDLEDGLAPLLDELDGDDILFVSKHGLAGVHGCEAKWLHEDEDRDFSWSVPLARGTVAHKAIELSVHWRGEPHPLDLLDEAIARLEEGTDGLADYLQTCTEVDRAELRAEANDRLVKFLECWPPLRKEWRPVTESRLRIPLFDERIVLSGKVDLSLGQAKGTTAGKVLVDLKTGSFSPAHQDDLRFYALLDALRLGIPPRRLASYYLDAGSFRAEDVSEALLRTTVRRVVDGAAKMVELRAKLRTPVRHAGPGCWWCPISDDCDVGQAFLGGQDEEP
jgi:hypothetical protein